MQSQMIHYTANIAYQLIQASYLVFKIAPICNMYSRIHIIIILKDMWILKDRNSSDGV